jgi:hypothetical protein
MLVDVDFDADVMTCAALAKRAGTPHQHATAVVQLVVERLDHVRTALAHAVRGGRRYLRVGAPSIGKVARVAAVAAGQRIPEPGERGRTARPQDPDHAALRSPFHGQPQPTTANHSQPQPTTAKARGSCGPRTATSRRIQVPPTAFFCLFRA